MYMHSVQAYILKHTPWYSKTLDYHTIALESYTIAYNIILSFVITFQSIPLYSIHDFNDFNSVLKAFIGKK